METAGPHFPRYRPVKLIVAIALLGAHQSNLAAAQAEPLVLESTIILKSVRGRLDHLAIDPQRQRLYVAEFGNDSVGVVDLKTGSVLQTVGGLREPQGLGYVRSTDTLYVANGGDGSVRLLRGADLSSVGRIELGEDADNIVVDRTDQRVYVGFGTGGIAVIDAARAKKIAEVPLKAHPENFQPDPRRDLLFVNVPDTHEIAVIDLAAGRQTLSWPTRELASNFPMAMSGDGSELWVAFRSPAEISAYHTQTGTPIGTLRTCADADDISLDAKRSWLYVSCGAGEIDVLEWREGQFRALGKIATRLGARTSLFDPGRDRLYLAVPANLGQPAAIYIYRPAMQ
ncbi:MAG TPA: YncE family protein [Steroidobacteraceae bacterium]|nr:YncE family protein [Steroidobacteraceae bacterium]